MGQPGRGAGAMEPAPTPNLCRDVVRPGRKAFRYSFLDVACVGQMYLISLILSLTFVIYDKRPQFLIPALVVNLAFLALCFLRNFRVAVVMVGIMLGIALSVVVFTIKVGVPFNVSQVGSYAAPFSLGLVGVYAARYPLPRALKMLFIASVLYAATFLYLHYSINVDAILQARRLERGAMAGFIQSHATLSGGDVSFRIFASDMHLAIGLFYSLAKFRDPGTRRKGLWGASACVFVFCFSISDFRFAQATALLLIVCSFLPIGQLAKIRVSAASTSFVMLMILIFSAFNINLYALFENDITGGTRYNEAKMAIEMFAANPLLGIGLAGNAEDMMLVVGHGTFAASDIGYLGMLCRFGLIGYAILYIGNMLMHRFVEQLQRNPQVDAATRRSLVDLLLYVMITQLLSTFVLDGGGALLLVFAIAYSGKQAAAGLKRRRAARAPHLEAMRVGHL
jgi:hypothetical protein